MGLLRSTFEEALYEAVADRYGIGHAFQMHVEPERLAAAYRTLQAKDILAFSIYQTAEQEHLPREQRLARLQEVFAGMDWLAEQFLSDVNPSESIFMDAVIQIQMPSWHRSREAMVGDACDCPTLLSGQGASLAMGGAYLLARALHETAHARWQSIATSSRCLNMSRRSKRASAGLPNPFYLEAPWVCSPNKR